MVIVILKMTVTLMLLLMINLSFELYSALFTWLETPLTNPLLHSSDGLIEVLTAVTTALKSQWLNQKMYFGPCYNPVQAGNLGQKVRPQTPSSSQSFLLWLLGVLSIPPA